MDGFPRAREGEELKIHFFGFPSATETTGVIGARDLVIYFKDVDNAQDWGCTPK